MTALEKIRIEAKKLRKAKPAMTYIEAIKQASKHYNAGKLDMVKKITGKRKKAPARMPLVKIVTTTTKEKPKKVGGINAETTYIHLIDIGKELRLLEGVITDFVQLVKMSKLMTEKSKYRRRVLEYKNQFKALKNYLNTRTKFI